MAAGVIEEMKEPVRYSRSTIVKMDQGTQHRLRQECVDTSKNITKVVKAVLTGVGARSPGKATARLRSQPEARTSDIHDIPSDRPPDVSIETLLIHAPFLRRITLILGHRKPDTNQDWITDICNVMFSTSQRAIRHPSTCPAENRDNRRQNGVPVVKHEQYLYK